MSNSAPKTDRSFVDLCTALCCQVGWYTKPTTLVHKYLLLTRRNRLWLSFFKLKKKSQLYSCFFLLVLDNTTFGCMFINLSSSGGS